MARLYEGGREARKERIWRLCDGWSEAEIAAALGIHRRTVNNYLRELANADRVVKWSKFYIRS